MALQFTSIKVLPNLQTGAAGGFDVFWSLSGATFTPSFQVYWAPTESGPWTALLDPKTTNNFLLNALEQRAAPQIGPLTWFKIEVFNGATSKLVSQPIDVRGAMDRRSFLIYRDALRRCALFFQKSQCLPGWLLRRIVYGTRCPVCTNEILKTPISSECTTCYGTGFTGGYYAPFPMRADWSAGASPRSSNLTTKENVGPIAVQRQRFKIYAVPDAKSDDVWYDTGTGVYYLVENVDPEMWCGSTLTQTLTTSRLPAHHPIYGKARPS